MKGAKQQVAGRVKRAYTRRAKPGQQQQRDQKKLNAESTTTLNGGSGAGGGGFAATAAASGYPVHVTEVVDDQLVGHLPPPQPIHSDVSELQERVNDLGDSWETESIFEDIIGDISQETLPDDVDACTREQSVAFRQQLRAIGPNAFCRLHIDSGAITARKMLTAFGIRPPEFLEGRPDEAYYGLLTLAMTRELNKRAKIMSYNSVDDAVHLLQKSRNIVVLTGAGISTRSASPISALKRPGCTRN
ncbi:hypothetical protein NPX13_g2611 [Xylaria arbuscula]|uniref:Deacetylase sirtuin-type domain-containing protein n=1 Tax=Xylaria arbuscula TaxID=114810 RepID=A0A9W8NJR5_9PEZI|nr:hypothetical protein NPX13_g2611 [Xylaria arbuscula]